MGSYDYSLNETDENYLKFVDVVNCVDWIPTIYPPEQAEKILSGIGSGYDNSDFLCPKIESYDLLNEDSGFFLAVDVVAGLAQWEIDLVYESYIVVDYVT